MEYKTWDQFYEDLIDDNSHYFWRILDETPQLELDKIFNIVNYNEEHILSRHYFDKEEDLLNRVCISPPLLGYNKVFSMFNADNSIIDNIKESIFASCSEIIKWLTYDRHQNEPIGAIDVEKYNDTGIAYVINSNNQLEKYNCSHFSLIIERDKSGESGCVDNPFHFKIITAYPNLVDAELIEDKQLQYSFADKLKDICSTNITLRLAWGLHLQGELINIRNEDLQNESSNLIAEGVIPIEDIPLDEKYYSVRTSERGKITINLVDMVAKRETPITNPDERLSRMVKRISKKTLNAWKDIDYIINNEVLGVGQLRADDNLFIGGKKNPFHIGIDDIEI